MEYSFIIIVRLVGLGVAGGRRIIENKWISKYFHGFFGHVGGRGRLQNHRKCIPMHFHGFFVGLGSRAVPESWKILRFLLIFIVCLVGSRRGWSKNH